jgi:hypothetical protein
MNQSSGPIRVLLTDDHPLFRRGMRVILGVEPGTELVGEATDGQLALVMALELRPDVILMDLDMPNKNGIVATRRGQRGGDLQSSDHAAPDGISRRPPGSPRFYGPDRQGRVLLPGGIPLRRSFENPLLGRTANRATRAAPVYTCESGPPRAPIWGPHAP